MLDHVVGSVCRSKGLLGTARAGEDQGAGHAGLVGHADVGGEAVAHEQRIPGCDAEPVHEVPFQVGGVRSFQPSGDRHRRPAPGAATGYAFLCSVVTVKVPSGNSPTR